MPFQYAGNVLNSNLVSSFIFCKNLVNLASTKVKDDASGVDLSKVILQVSMKINKLPTDVAVEYLKKEIRQLF